MKTFKIGALAAIATCLMLASCEKKDVLNLGGNDLTQDFNRPEQEPNNPDEAAVKNADANLTRWHHGHLYTSSNTAGQNAVLHYTHGWDGMLTYEGSYNTGGAGAGMALGSQGAVCLSDNGEWLFVVNAGDNTVSSFKINDDGTLELISTVSSAGTMPVSVTSKHNLVYVVNSTSANIAGFHLDIDGALTFIAGSVQPLSASNATPAQISFGPNNSHKLFVTEKMTNKISAFSVNNDGTTSPAFVRNSEGGTPFGFEFAREQYMIVSEAHGGAPNASTVSSYKPAGMNLMTRSAAVPNDQTAACWVATTHYGMYAFVTNTGSNSISTYYVSPSGHLYNLYAAAANTGMAPTDVTLSGNNLYVYNVNEMSHTIGQYKRGFLGSLTELGEVSGLPDFAAGIAAK